MDSHIEILKSLIDSLTSQLTNILVKIESINPILNRLLDEAKSENQISRDTFDKLKELESEYSNNQQFIQQLPQTIKSISDIQNTLSSINSDINNFQTDMVIVKKQLIPVNKFSRFALKPIGVVLFLFSMVGCIMGIIEAVKFVINR